MPLYFSRYILLIFLFVSVGIHAQYLPNIKSNGYWLAYTGDNKLNTKFGIHSEAQFRNFGVNKSMEQMLLRIGVNYYADPLVMISAGYGFIHTKSNSIHLLNPTTQEHRIWEQLILRHKTKRVFMEHRYRIEQRFIENIDHQIHSINHRVRYRFQTLLPLYSISPHLRHYFVNFSNEVFVNLNTNSTMQVFDRNRFYAALGYQVSPKLNFQMGYLNQFINLPKTNNAENNHLLQMSVSFNMDDLMKNFITK